MTVKPIIRTPALQAELEMKGVLHAMDLLVNVWAIPTNQAEWLSVSNALWQAARVSRELRLLESATMLEEMADLASIRATLEEVAC